MRSGILRATSIILKNFSRTGQNLQISSCFEKLHCQRMPFHFYERYRATFFAFNQKFYLLSEYTVFLNFF